LVQKNKRDVSLIKLDNTGLREIKNIEGPSTSTLKLYTMHLRKVALNYGDNELHIYDVSNLEQIKYKKTAAKGIKYTNLHFGHINTQLFAGTS
jgi:hypothetical protein